MRHGRTRYASAVQVVTFSEENRANGPIAAAQVIPVAPDKCANASSRRFKFGTVPIPRQGPLAPRCDATAPHCEIDSDKSDDVLPQGTTSSGEGGRM